MSDSEPPAVSAQSGAVHELLSSSVLQPKIIEVYSKFFGGLMRIDDVLQRIQGEYVEMPGLRLTPAQAQRLWGLERDVCDALLGALVDAKFLSQTRDGAYVRTDGARPSAMTDVQRGRKMAVA